MRGPLLLLLLGCSLLSSTAQTFNVQNYTPSVLLKVGQWEAKHYNNLYTQTYGFDAAGERQILGERGTWFASINTVTTGVSSRLNVGAELWLRSVRIDAPESSALDLFRFQNNPMARTALAYGGPKVKWLPFANQQRLSVQSTLLIPLAANLQGEMRNQPWLDADRYLWITQLLWDQNLSEHWQVFADVAAWASIDRMGDGSATKFETPAKVFVSYFPTSRFTAFAMTEFWPTYGTKKWISSYFWQVGLGSKVQIIPGLLEGEAMVTQFLKGKNNGAGRTFNLGVRVIWGS